MNHGFARLVRSFTQKLHTLAERGLVALGADPATVRAGISGLPRHMIKGFCMGSADIIPGVSGGTMALILGIYERLLKAIGSFDRAWLKDLFYFRVSAAFTRNDLLFLLPLGAGIVLALLFFTRVIPLPQLIVSYPEPVYGLFFGLILASIVLLFGEVDKYGPKEFAITLVGVMAGFVIVNLVPVETPTAPWFIFLCGFVAISAMLLPGISGSFILLILGKYAFIIDAFGHFDAAVMATFAVGALTGLVVFSRAIVWLLNRFRQATLLVIKGILIGSLWMIWPFQERIYETVRGQEKLVGGSPMWPQALTPTVAFSLVLLLAGLVLVMFIHRLSVGHEKPRP